MKLINPESKKQQYASERQATKLEKSKNKKGGGKTKETQQTLIRQSKRAGRAQRQEVERKKSTKIKQLQTESDFL